MAAYFTDGKKKFKKSTTTVNNSVTNALINANYSINNIKRYSFQDDKHLSIESDFDDLLEASTKDKSYSISNPLMYKIIVKADSQSGLDAILQSIGQCADKRVKFDLVGCGIGLPTTDEIVIAKNTKSNIYCFFPNSDIAQLMSTDAGNAKKTSDISIEFHDIIYDLIDSIKEHIEMCLGDTITISKIGEAKVKKVFQFTGKMKHIVAGCEVVTGAILSKSLDDLTYCLIYEGEQLIKKSTIKTLKQFKKDTDQVREGSDCGIVFNDFNQIKESQLIKQYKIVKERVPLDWKI